MPMSSTALTTFVHPQEVYRLEYPVHWEQVVQDDARSCGFGPRDRDDVGLWISILPMSVDTDRLAEDLPKLMREALPKFEAENLRPDPTLRHHGLKADIRKDGQGGHYWIVAGGDVVLFASSQVPEGERDNWNPPFDRLMESVQITRDDELLMRRVANEVLVALRERNPEEEFEFDGKGIRGRGQVVNLGNVYREVRTSPKHRAKIIKHFVEGLSQSAAAPLGTETWDEARPQIVPVLKPHNYIQPDTPTQHLQTTEWLADVLICYAIKNKKFFRFVTGWDVNRWGITAEMLHRQSIENLARLPWPERLEGSRQKDGGRVILVDTHDSLAASRLLHPELHHLFSGPLGSPFWAGIPDRDTLVTFSDRRSLKQRIGRQIRKDHHSSAYPISPRPFLVTRDGIAPAPES
jgi:uncharacterized protein YtpQ (UPF0354 family)